MNLMLKRQAWFSAVTIVLTAFAAGVSAQDPYLVRKAQFYLQTSASGAVLHSTAPYVFAATGRTTGLTLNVPGGSAQSLPYDAGDDSYQVVVPYGSKAALDAAYPNGTYTITGSGQPTRTFSLTPDRYPTAAPEITNGTWTNGVLVINPAQSYTFNLSNFTTYASTGVAGHESFNVDTGTSNGFQQEIATQAIFGLTASATPLTSVTMPAGTLTTGNVYRLDLQFDTLTTLDAGTGSVALFTNQLEVWVAALAPGTTAMAAPAITAHPSNRTGSLGGSVTFSATVNLGGPGNPRGLWYLNGLELSTGNNSTKYTQGFNNGVFTLTVNNITNADLGSYNMKVVDTGGIATTNSATLTLGTASTPSIVTQPLGHTVATGSSVVFSVEASGGNLTYQWYKGGVVIPGATGSQLFISNAQAGNAGSYTVAATNGSGTATSNAAVLSVVTSSDPGRLINVSVRIVSGTGADTLFMGFVTGGNGTSGGKQLLIRGIGPTLGSYGVLNVMADPVLDVIPQGASTPLVTNDDWSGDAGVVTVANAVGAFALPSTTSKDSALVTTLNPGVYSAKVSGKNNTTGTVLAEIYDANPGVYSASTPRLVNISARATMANDNPLIAGFVVGGTTAKTLLIRAIGPALIPYGVTAAMPDPYLEIIRSGQSTASYSNDNWGGSTLVTNVGNSVGAFALTDGAGKDAVLLVTLDPGVYSAKVTGVNNTSGITLVEVYEVP
ncbi:MAG TPA: immunoglobulin domain-containing protein [Opitutaceae bacterium]|nr:immunoglobulin domain-containing protein [Opitutaceae bacterium]HND61415.1 immunoglobulin domain-containing protein [Opitutaceae bacterium]